MGHYCARTPKRHYGYANSPWISSLDKGVLSGWKKGDRKVKTAVSYTNKDGKKCYKGTPALRSEYLAHIFDLIISYIIIIAIYFGIYTPFITFLFFSFILMDSSICNHIMSLLSCCCPHVIDCSILLLPY